MRLVDDKSVGIVYFRQRRLCWFTVRKFSHKSIRHVLERNNFSVSCGNANRSFPPLPRLDDLKTVASDCTTRHCQYTRISVVLPHISSQSFLKSWESSGEQIRPKTCFSFSDASEWGKSTFEKWISDLPLSIPNNQPQSIENCHSTRLQQHTRQLDLPWL